MVAGLTKRISVSLFCSVHLIRLILPGQSGPKVERVRVNDEKLTGCLKLRRPLRVVQRARSRRWHAVSRTSTDSFGKVNNKGRASKGTAETDALFPVTLLRLIRRFSR